MNRIVNNKYQEEYYEETMPNGLRVQLWHKKDFKKSFFIMATPFGAVDTEQIDSDGNIIKYPEGIAHFLEHKLFETEDNRDVMDDFSAIGANVNASTSYDETCYYFSTSQAPHDALNLLLDFTQDLNITEESVNKEKGIITQEHQMYQQMSESRLIHETFKSLFNKHPLKYEIDGTLESIKNTSVDDLRKCFEINYHPSNMVLAGVTSYDIEEIMGLIRENQKGKKFSEFTRVNKQEWNEPDCVSYEKYEFKMDVKKPKVNVAYKLKGIADPIENEKMETALKIIFDCYFSSLNPLYQEWLESGLINDFYGYEINISDDIAYCMIYAETTKIDEFVSKADTVFNQALDNEISNELIEQLKRRYHGQNIRYLNDFESLSIMTARCMFDHVNVFDILDITETLSLDDIRKAQNYAKENSKSIIICKPLNE